MIGTDIIEVSRIETSIKRFGKRFLNRVFTKQEQLYCYQHKHPAQHFAVRFAAKEAIYKALGLGSGWKWTDIEVIRQANTAPEVKLHKEIVDNRSVFLSMSHCVEYAVATALVK